MNVNKFQILCFNSVAATVLVAALLISGCELVSEPLEGRRGGFTIDAPTRPAALIDEEGAELAIAVLPADEMEAALEGAPAGEPAAIEPDEYRDLEEADEAAFVERELFQEDTSGGIEADLVPGDYHIQVVTDPHAEGRSRYLDATYLDSSDPESTFSDPLDPVTLVPGAVETVELDLFLLEPGTLKWAFAFHEPDGTVYSSPAVVDGTVYTGAGNDNVYAVDAETGEKVWAFEEPTDAVNSSPAVVDGTVYVGSGNDNKLYAINAQTGEEVWVFEGPTDAINSSPAVV